MPNTDYPSLGEINAIQTAFEGAGYICTTRIATVVKLAAALEKPVLIEGPPGVGKTELAKTCAKVVNRPLVRLQCYEGLDVNHAVYEWDYPRQMLAIQAKADASSEVADLFSEEFLLRRPLLHAIDRSHEQAPVLLIDELDRADEEFESFLLELLGDFQITIPELGTYRAKHAPIVIITSNRTREIHDALKRRCIYHWIDYPARDQELRIVRNKAPEVGAQLATQVVDFVQRLRGEELYKVPGVAESLDWARALAHLSTEELHPEVVDRTLGLLLKYQDDVDVVRGRRTAELLTDAGTP